MSPKTPTETTKTAATDPSRSKHHGLDRRQLNRLLAGQMPDCYNVFVMPWEDGYQPQVVIIRGGQPYTALDIRGPTMSTEKALRMGYEIAMSHRQAMFIQNAALIVFRNGPIVEGQVNWPWQ